MFDYQAGEKYKLTLIMVALAGMMAGAFFTILLSAGPEPARVRPHAAYLDNPDITGGKPIGKSLTEARINFINVNSQTPDPQSYYKEADIIITAVGKKILLPETLKPGVALINVGLRREKGKFKGDYEEKEIKNIAGFYTSTPGGAGPIDVLYLFKNLIEAAKQQK